MLSSVLPVYRFHLRQLRQYQPIAFWLLMAAIGLMVVSIVILIRQANVVHEAEAQFDEVRLAVRASSSPRSSNDLPTTALPAFDNALLVSTLDRLSTSRHLPLDEVTYTLDENANLPYLRYRITMTVTARYPLLRSFVDDVRHTMSNATLDTMACSRVDIGATELTCDLAFSTFYAKAAHG